MNNKIKNILLMKDMSPSRFADEIGVQRSSISHILSGRNKPSLEIIQKIVRRFPELGMDWIMEEEETEEETEITESTNIKTAVASTVSNPLKANASMHTNGTGEKEILEETENIQKRKVEKILIFYSDKTFTEYKPE
jgi:transcriptional regulator with XRE-family HTH domain